MVLNMDRDGEYYFNEEFCFFDGKYKCCCGFVILIVSVYNLLLWK